MFAKVNKKVAEFLWRNKIVHPGKNLYYAEVLTRVPESTPVENVNMKTLYIIVLKCCPELKFIEGVDIELCEK